MGMWVWTVEGPRRANCHGPASALGSHQCQLSRWLTDSLLQQPTLTNLISIGVLAWSSGVSCKYRLKSMRPIWQINIQQMTLTNPHHYFTSTTFHFCSSTGFLFQSLQSGQLLEKQRLVGSRKQVATKTILITFRSHFIVSFNFYVIHICS